MKIKKKQLKGYLVISQICEWVVLVCKTVASGAYEEDTITDFLYRGCKQQCWGLSLVASHLSGGEDANLAPHLHISNKRGSVNILRYLRQISYK